MCKDQPEPWRQLAKYQAEQTYDWNYENPPDRVKLEIPPMRGEWRFCGAPVDSPLGVSAGPLLNGAWCLYYAGLGFSVVTYKTVRSSERPCYPPPNLQPVRCGSLKGGEQRLPAIKQMEGSWAVSYGMPSQPPSAWRDDVLATRTRLPSQTRLVVSVVGTTQPGWSLEQLADDYAECARMAVECGADAVETNFSCPNVSTCDGQLYQDPDAARLVIERVRQVIQGAPLIVKIGHVPLDQSAAELVGALAPSVNAISATNSIAATVVDEDGQLMFSGLPRGICGAATLDSSVAQVARLRRAMDEQGLDAELIGVGGISSSEDAKRHLAAGATTVQMATSAMARPWTALAIRKEW
jgi:dihydroorotate dehydrogenase